MREYFLWFLDKLIWKLQRLRDKIEPPVYTATDPGFFQGDGITHRGLMESLRIIESPRFPLDSVILINPALMPTVMGIDIAFSTIDENLEEEENEMPD